MDNIGTFQVINESNPEHIAILSQDNLYGAIGTKAGTILKPEYEELTFQHINNTLIFIGMKPLPNKEVEIFYINLQGKIIRKIKTDIDTGYSILCDN
jgi:hypothetical protein